MPDACCLQSSLAGSQGDLGKMPSSSLHAVNNLCQRLLPCDAIFSERLAKNPQQKRLLKYLSVILDFYRKKLH